MTKRTDKQLNAKTFADLCEPVDQELWEKVVAEVQEEAKEEGIVFQEDLADWCKCDLAKMGITPMRVHFEDGPCGSTLICEVTKHHYHCSKCGGVTQIG